MAVEVSTTEENASITKVINTLVSGAFDTVHWKFHRPTLLGGRWGPRAGGICCGSMPTNDRSNVDGILMTLNKSRDGVESSRKWWKLLLDPDHSPWHRVLKDVKMYELEDNRYDVFYMALDDTTGFRDAINLFIGLRQTYEAYGAAKNFHPYWDELKKTCPDATFSEALAMFSFSSQGKFYERSTQFSNGHGFLSMGTSNPISIAKRTPSLDPTTLKGSYHYNLSDMIWINDKYLADWKAFVHSHVKVTPPSGSFGTYRSNTMYSSYGMSSFNAVIEPSAVLKFFREYK